MGTVTGCELRESGTRCCPTVRPLQVCPACESHTPSHMQSPLQGGQPLQGVVVPSDELLGERSASLHIRPGSGHMPLLASLPTKQRGWCRRNCCSWASWSCKRRCGCVALILFVLVLIAGGAVGLAVCVPGGCACCTSASRCCVLTGGHHVLQVSRAGQVAGLTATVCVQLLGSKPLAVDTVLAAVHLRRRAEWV